MYKRIAKIVLIAIIVTATLPQFIFPVVKTKVSEQYYFLSAENLNRLHWKLKRNLITDNYGNKFIALTSWDVSWQVHTLSDNEKCAVSDVVIAVDIKYTYPKWSNIIFAPTIDRTIWNRFITNLKKHEEGHAEIGKEAGEMIEKALLEIKPAPTCAELEEIVRARANAIHQEYALKDEAYDRETNHGANQGAVLASLN